jgi:hypothetical protein
VSVSVSFGSGVGWFPLAPHEVYVPWYRHTPRYVRHVNVSNTIIVNNINVTNVYGRPGHRPRYTYGGLGNAVTAAQRDVFVSGRPVGGQRVRVNDRELRQWRDNVRPASIAPVRQSILAGQPRRQVTPAAFANDNARRGNSGDFRAARVAAEEIKRAQDRQRNVAPENRIALRDTTRPAQSVPARTADRQSQDRGNSMRGREQNDRGREQDTPRVRDHMERAPAVQSLQSSPSTGRRSTQSGSNEVRRPRETLDDRDTFQRSDNNRRELREQPREFREPPPARQYSQPERQAPVERRAAPVVRDQPRVERSQSETREFRSSPPPQRVESSPPPQRQNNNQGSNSNRRGGGDDNRGSSRDRPNNRPD